MQFKFLFSLHASFFCGDMLDVVDLDSDFTPVSDSMVGNTPVSDSLVVNTPVSAVNSVYTPCLLYTSDAADDP